MAKSGRAYHYLTAPTADSWPQRVVCFNVTPTIIEASEHAKVKRCEVSGWETATLDLVDGEYWVKSATNGTNADVFWKHLRGLLLGQRLTWAIGWRTAFTLALTGFWDLVEEDQWLLADDDHSAPANADGTRPQRSVGVCVLEDPPTIVMAKPARHPGTLKLLDVQNYGLQSPPTNSDGELTAMSIAHWFTDYAAALRLARLGGPENTAACQAYRGFRRSYMRAPVLVHCDATALAIERDALYGGRNECFRMGMVYGPVYELDFNSHYPAVAQCLGCPTRLAGCAKIDRGEIESLVARGYAVAASVSIEACEPWFPLRRPGETIFPVGQFKTTLAGPELELALECNAVTEIHYASWYETDQLFGPWVSALYDMRQAARATGQVGCADAIKRLLVGLFGKFAQRHWSWVDAANVEADAPFTTWYAPRPEDRLSGLAEGEVPSEPWDKDRCPADRYCRWRAVGWRCQYQSEPSEHRQSCPAITAWVYSAARVALLHAMKVAGSQNVYYCDTDSLWVSHTGYKCLERCGMIDADRLGALKVEAVHPWVRFLGLKHYETATAQVHAGVSKDAVRVGDWTWEQYVGEGMGSAAHNCRAPTAIAYRQVAKHRQVYRHGRVDRLGRVRPLVLRET